MAKLIEQLRDGCVLHPKRWSGDTHDDLGGSIQEGATNALMEQAATELEALRKRCEAVEADAARYRWLRHKLTCGHFATAEEAAFLDAKDGASLDAAIDQAIAATQEPSHG